MKFTAQTHVHKSNFIRATEIIAVCTSCTDIRFYTIYEQSASPHPPPPIPTSTASILHSSSFVILRRSRSVLSTTRITNWKQNITANGQQAIDEYCHRGKYRGPCNVRHLHCRVSLYVRKCTQFEL